MFEKAADVVAGDVGKPCVAGFIVEKWLAVPPEGLVGVHAGAAIASQWLRHKSCGLPVVLGGIADDVFESLHVIAGVQQIGVLVVDLLDTAGGHLMVEALNIEADFL